jgi:hypothetical protein
MKAIDFMPEMTIPLGKDQDEFFTLPAIKVIYPDTEGFITAWKPEWRDILRFLIGKPVYLLLLVQQHPPTLLTTCYKHAGLDQIEKRDE